MPLTPEQIAADTPAPGPTDLERRNAALEKAHQQLTNRNAILAGKELQAATILEAIAERMRSGAPPPISEIERAAEYFREAGVYTHAFVWPIGPPPATDDDGEEDYPGNS